ncbi:large ribosomal RNA subunit accumulation protein YCED homolog 1, chloroplastic-like [Oryza glaberrima]|nr:large ribosomal RNA subunit accumulation protein YCED homolog 1, chloroplastic-like [Oryza glaberrima]
MIQPMGPTTRGRGWDGTKRRKKKLGEGGEERMMVGVGIVGVAGALPLVLRRTRTCTPPPPMAMTPLHHTCSFFFRPQPSPSLSHSPCAAADDDDFFTVDYDPEEEEEEDEEGSPWEGAVVYRRDASVHHLEYATTLERLGLGDLSSTHSRARAATMGILILSSTNLTGTKDDDTPVLVSLDVARRRGRLRLDGIVRTVITLGCYGCAEPAPQGIFANFSLLLTEDRVEEPDVVDLGTIFEEEQTKAPSLTGSQEDGDDEDIDWDDRLHFPAGEKEIDISKHIRDIIHLEITLDALCSPTCKGLCLGCGENLNTSSCSCNAEKQQAKNVQRRGPLKDLLKPLQR